METSIRLVSERWGLSNVRCVEPLSAKGQRQVIRFTSSEGEWVLKVVDPSRSAQLVERDVEALSFLSERELAPAVRETVDGQWYIERDTRLMYLMAYVEGRPVREGAEDLYQLGVAAARLHGLQGYHAPSAFDAAHVNLMVKQMSERFSDRPFKQAHDRVLASLPDFSRVHQSFIHTDIGPHNAIMDNTGRIRFIDLDDAGIGPTCIDAGYPLICQFVRIRANGEPSFDDSMAKAFYSGYLSHFPVAPSDRQHFFSGAVFMQLMYMDAYGESGIDPMWRILEYALKHEEVLRQAFE